MYNGDLNSPSDLEQIRQLIPSQNEWMLGRGILSDPFLIREIENRLPEIDRQRDLKREFHEFIFEEYQRHFTDQGQVLMKMKAFWSYFANSFSNPHKAFKSVKKSSSLEKFRANYPSIFQNFDL